MSARRTIEKVEAQFSEIVRGQTWKTSHAKYRFICETHGEYRQSYDKHNSGQGCPECGIEKRGKSQRLTIGEAEANCPDMVKGQTWTNARSKYWFLCKTHGEYKQEYDAHQRGSGCQTCSGHTLMNIEVAEANCPDMVKGQTWTGNAAKYKFVCKKHGVYEQSYASHQQGCGCRECGWENTGKALSLGIGEAEANCPDMVRGQVWKTNVAKYWFVCKKHGNYKQSYAKHTSGQGCQKCGREKIGDGHRHTIAEIEAQFSDMVKGQTWKGAKAKYKFVCKKHGVYEQPYASHRVGCGCPECGESRGEKVVAEILTVLKIPFKREKRFDDCRDSGVLPFDFYLPKLKTLIEYHGAQHFCPVRFGGIVLVRAKHNFEKAQHHDRIKKAWAGRNGYTLIVVPYTIENVASFLGDMLPKREMAGAQ